MTRLHNFLIFAFSIISFTIFGQTTINFSAGNNGQTVSTCSGFLIDSGGQGGNGYGNNENTVLTICPDNAEDIVNIHFTSFNLSNQSDSGNPQVPNVDYMDIYDGNTVDGTHMGTYSGTQLFNVVIQPTELNPTGCITLRFRSNSVGTGSFGASVTCSTPCVNPIASAEIVGAPVYDSIAICVGDVVNFANTNSFAQPGFNIASYSWDFMDGTVATGPNVSHAFTQPGLYQINLMVQDDNQDNVCVNTNLTQLRVYVSTFPNFQGIPDEMNICIGSTQTVTVDPSQLPVEWFGFPGATVVEDGCITDTQLGVVQQVPLVQTGFTAGSTIQSAADITSICLDMEHTFIGDLLISLTCPNGQTVIMHQQGGSGTNLGTPVTSPAVNCDNPATQGVPGNYCWTNDATITWAQSSTANGTVVAGGLVEGNYRPVSSFDGFIGCPTNGIWTLNITDLWAADDGTVFGFQLNLNPDFYPDDISFQPSIGTELDSSFFTTDATTQLGAVISGDGDVISFAPTVPGTYNVGYQVVNNFGCVATHQIAVTVPTLAVINAGLDTNICVGTTLVNAVSAVPATPALVYSWSPAAHFNNPNIGNANFTPPLGTYNLTLTAHPVGKPECISTDTKVVNVINPPYAGADGEITLCTSADLVDLFTLIGGNPTPGGVWRNPNNQVVQMPFNPATGSQGNYRYTVGSGTCSDFAIVRVTLFNTTINNFAITNVSCNSGEDGRVNITGTGFNNYVLTGGNANGQTNVITGPFALENLIAGDYSLTISSNDGCSTTRDFVITEPNPLTLNSISPDTLICGASEAVLRANGQGGSTELIFTWVNQATNEVVGQGSVLPLIPNQGTTNYCVTLTETCGSPSVQLCTSVTTEETIIPAIIPTPFDGCEPLLVNFENTSNGNILTTTVNFGDGNTIVYQGQEAFEHIYFYDGAYSLSVEMISELGCIYNNNFPNLITVHPIPEAIFNYSPNPVNMFNTEVSFTDLSVGDIQNFQWSFEGASPATSSIQNPKAKFLEGQEGTYEVQLVVTTAFGCTDTTSRLVQVVNDVLIYAPNTFTPDGDEFNQTFRIHMSGIDNYSYHMQIFNRWGEMIFESFDQSFAWDGTYNGKIVQDGAYNWKVRARDLFTDKKYEFSGAINVIR